MLENNSFNMCKEAHVEICFAVPNSGAFLTVLESLEGEKIHCVDRTKK